MYSLFVCVNIAYVSREMGLIVGIFLISVGACFLFVVCFLTLVWKKTSNGIGLCSHASLEALD